MTDPTTRYPLPDDPGADPLAVPPPPPAADAVAPVDAAAPVDATAPVDAAPPASDGSVPPTAVGSANPPPPAPGPAWTPPTTTERRWPAVIFGLILVGIGLWFFAEVTLGLDLPTIRWSQLWPLILIVIGVLVLYGSRLGRSR